MQNGASRVCFLIQLEHPVRNSREFSNGGDFKSCFALFLDIGACAHDHGTARSATRPWQSSSHPIEFQDLTEWSSVIRAGKISLDDYLDRSRLLRARSSPGSHEDVRLFLSQPIQKCGLGAEYRSSRSILMATINNESASSPLSIDTYQLRRSSNSS